MRPYALLFAIWQHIDIYVYNGDAAYYLGDDTSR